MRLVVCKGLLCRVVAFISLDVRRSRRRRILIPTSGWAARATAGPSSRAVRIPEPIRQEVVILGEHAGRVRWVITLPMALFLDESAPWVHGQADDLDWRSAGSCVVLAGPHFYLP